MAMTLNSNIRLTFKERILVLLKRFVITKSHALGELHPFLSKVYANYYKAMNYVRHQDVNFFRSVYIETSTYCNRTCSYCPNSEYGTPTDYMTEEVFKKSIQRLKNIQFDGSLIFHFFNEPLLDERLTGFIRYAKDNLPDCICRIFTNGDYLTLDKADELIAAGVRDVVITNHDQKPEMFLRRLKPVLDKYRNFMEVQSLHDQPMWNQGGLVEVDRPENKQRDSCTEPLMSCVIDYNGNVLLCGSDYFRANKFGNVMEEELKVIWNNATFSKLRRELREGITSLEMCAKCLGKDTN